MKLHNKGLLLAASTLLVPVFGSAAADATTDTVFPTTPPLTTTVKASEWVEDAVIYQVFVRAFSPEGTLKGVTDRLEYIASLGVNTIYLMPIHPIGETRRVGTLGSPYSIRDHLQVDPALGTLADLQELVSRAHSLGLRVLLDLVPNHTSFDNPLIAEHPEWYVRDADGDPLPPNKDWLDVAQLNYADPGLRRYMIDVAAYWLQATGIDGFRVDAPVYVPLDFWRQFYAEIKTRFPQALLLAESGESWLMEAFDAQYDWNFLTMIADALRKGSDPQLVLAEIDYWRDPAGKLIPKLRYLENHDHDRFLGRFSKEELIPAATALLTLPGIPMIYAGQEIGAAVRPSLFDPFKVDWNTVDEHVLELYRQLIGLRQSQAALQRGELVPIAVDRSAAGEDAGGGDVGGDEGSDGSDGASNGVNGVLAFGRVYGEETILVVANFRPKTQRVRLDLGGTERLGSPADVVVARVIPLWTSWEAGEVAADTEATAQGEAAVEAEAKPWARAKAEVAAEANAELAAEANAEIAAGTDTRDSAAGLLKLVLPSYGAAVYRLVPKL